ncbi:MAG: bifunctional ornithine acetyltransferase/N-acetylglutamate synthase, partial [Proteobacteria bacterium]|nr:bifunctional ornithine acetyltransferase/N-acetylglutamate synthase [Pseudomonadota bacterium]
MKSRKKNIGTSAKPLSCPGFKAAGISCGIKSGSKKDLALIVSDVPARMAGVFTTSKVKAAPVVLDQKLIKREWSRGVIVNSGKANACTGKEGLKSAEVMVSEAAKALGFKNGQILNASTGSIGGHFPIDKITGRIPALV